MNYTLHLTKKQAEVLSYACDRFSRVICGQDWTFQEMMEQAWERRCKAATGSMMDKNFEGGWSDMRLEAEDICRKVKKRFWGLGHNAMFGIHYDDTADILYDLHQVIRHQLWLDRPDNEKTPITVDASTPMKVGSEPLAGIESKEIKYVALDTLLETLPFATRTKGIFSKHHIITVADLLQLRKTDLLRFPNCGVKTLKEIIGFLAAHGLSLKGPYNI